MTQLTRTPDPRIDEAKAQDVEALCERLGLVNLRRHSGELSGPCPNCGGRDRFNIRLDSGVFLCRQCDVKGGDVIALVMQVENIDFLAALTWICGDKPADPAEVERRRRRAAADRVRQDRKAQRARQEAINSARTIWRAGKAATGSPVQEYLAKRGLPKALLPQLPDALRYHPALRYMEHHKDRGWVEIHKGPAMLAKMVQPDGRFGGVHRTWLDLSKPGGKIAITRPSAFRSGKPGETFDAKKTLGSKRGGTIRLALPRGARKMVVGEGIETTLTAMLSGAQGSPTEVAFICAIDLGNMAGDRLPVVIDGKKPSKRFSPLPDMADNRAFVPPEWVEELVFIKDGDSDPKFTDACLRAGLQRAMKLRPGLKAYIWPAPEGLDLNDLVRG